MNAAAAVAAGVPEAAGPNPAAADGATVALADLLCAALAAPAGSQIRGLRRLSGGASQETWAFDLVSPGAPAEPLVLRRAATQAPGRFSGAAGLWVEADLIALAGRHGVPVPALRARLPDAGRPGYVMQRLAGETLGRRIVTDPRLASARGRLAHQCGQALARIHALPPAPVPGLPAGGPAAELERYRQWHASHGTLRPVFRLALHWLAEHRPPEPAALAVVHGDFRNGNLMVDEQGLRGVLDWELAHRGDPMEDLAWLCVNAWRFGRHGLPVGGFGTLDDLLAGYRAAGGQPQPERLHWWQVMGTLKWGLVCESMLQAWLDGTGRQVEKAAIGRRASEAEIDLLELLAPLGARAA